MPQEPTHQSQIVKLPQFSCIAFRVLAEGLVWSRASGHRTRWGSWKCGWWGLRDLLSKVANPFLLLILGQGQQEHVPGRGHIVVYCRGRHKVFPDQESILTNMTQEWPLNIKNYLFFAWLTDQNPNTSISIFTFTELELVLFRHVG